MLFGVVITSHNLLPVIYGRDTIYNKSKITNQQTSGPSLAISTDKLRYMIDEHVTVFGTISDNGSFNQNPQKVILTVDFIGNTSKTHPWPWHDISSTRRVYYGSVYATNNSFVASISDTAVSGRYNVSATLADSRESSFTTFEVENPYTTSFAVAFYFGTALLVIFLFVLAVGTFNAGVVHLGNFLFLSGYVISILVSLTTSAVDLGPNSPIGLVLKHSVDQRGQIKVDSTGKSIGESAWVMNIGGTQETNYTNGIQVPVYVIVFGLLGGYLRYLYETATTARKNAEEESKKIDDYVNTFSPQQLNEVDVIPSGLDRKFRRDYVNRIEEMKNEDDKSDPLKIQKYVLRFRLNRRYLLFQSLKNLALLLLAPLLATAIWFLLVQSGVEDQQDTTRGQTGIFILAAISFTIGLVTNEAIQLLINFAKDRFGGVRDDALSKPDISLGVEDIKNPILQGEDQKVTITVTHNGSAVEEALIKATVSKNDDKFIYKFPGFTDSSGKFTYSWRIEANTYPAGMYTIKLEISAEGYRNNSFITKFEVLAKD
jgi:hypothetical protein